jgi:hypothetical protein
LEVLHQINLQIEFNFLDRVLIKHRSQAKYCLENSFFFFNFECVAITFLPSEKNVQLEWLLYSQSGTVTFHLHTMMVNLPELPLVECLDSAQVTEEVFAVLGYYMA